jgi:hypothetical protein
MSHVFRFVMSKYWKACYKDMYEFVANATGILVSCVLLHVYTKLPNPYLLIAIGLVWVFGMVALFQMPSGQRLLLAVWLIVHPPVLRDGQCLLSHPWNSFLTNNTWSIRQWVVMTNGDQGVFRWMTKNPSRLTHCHPAVWGMYHHDVELFHTFRHMGPPNGVQGSPLVYAFLQRYRDRVQELLSDGWDVPPPWHMTRALWINDVEFPSPMDGGDNRRPRDYRNDYDALVHSHRAILGPFLLPHLIRSLTDLVMDYVVHRWCACARCNGIA